MFTCAIGKQKLVRGTKILTRVGKGTQKMNC